MCLPGESQPNSGRPSSLDAVNRVARNGAPHGGERSLEGHIVACLYSLRSLNPLTRNNREPRFFNGPLVVQDICVPGEMSGKGTDFAQTPIDGRRGSGRPTFVTIMRAADLRKCDDLASQRAVGCGATVSLFLPVSQKKNASLTKQGSSRRWLPRRWSVAAFLFGTCS